jgi:sucrose phosphorylase
MPRFRRRHLADPDYTRPRLDIPDAARERITDALTVLYGRDKADACWSEVERLIRVHYAHKTPEIIADEASFDPRTRFTEEDIVAITYGDLINSPKMHPLRALSIIFEHLLQDVFNTVHLLPFYPYSSDRGFSVIDYTEVDPRMGTWDDVERLGDRYRMMFDGVINHISSRSEWFREFVNRNPRFTDYFISFDHEKAIAEKDLRLILRPRTSNLLTRVETLDGPRWVWTTFSPDQVDLNFRNETVLFRVLSVLLLYVRRGADIIRLDAATYLWREIGTSSAHLPQTHALVQFFRAVIDVAAPQVSLITETNVPHADNISYFGDGTNEAHIVYNFALPPLVLWTFHSGDATILGQWAASLETPSEFTTFFNFLDSHDGIGILPVQTLLTDAQREELVERTYAHGGLVSYRTGRDGRSVPYELNIPWYNALNSDDDIEPEEHKVRKFLASRAIALTLPGVAAVYLPSIVGAHVTAGQTVNEKDPRSINRNTIHLQELLDQLEEPDSHASRILLPFGIMIRARSRCRAFHPSARFREIASDRSVLAFMRETRDDQARVLVLTNVTAGHQVVTIPASQLRSSAVYWTNLLTDQRVRVAGDGSLRIALDAYAVWWLEPVSG